MLTVLQAPLGHCERAADQRDRARALRFAQPRPHAHRDQRRFAAGKEVGKALLGGARLLHGVVEHERVDEARIVERGRCTEAVLRPQQLELLGVAFARDLPGFFAEPARFGGAAALAEREATDCPVVLCGLFLRPAALRGEHPVDLFDGLVDEGARADHDLDGAESIQLGAGAVDPSLAGQPGGGDLAREASLEAQQAVDVGAQQHVLEVALHQHIHRLFPERAVVALRRSVASAGAPDEGVGRGARTQAQRQRGAAQPEHPITATTSSGRRAAPRARKRARPVEAKHRWRARMRTAHTRRLAKRTPTTKEDRQVEAASHSIPSGPADSPERNWRTKGFSEANSSARGPIPRSVRRHRIEMCSATRRAERMSWVITT